jgi:carbon monoxide dehydrogenase subunit G
MPGAEVTERVDDHNYKAKLTTAVGPIRPSFDVKARVERDDSAKEGNIDVNAVDRRGGSQARARIVYRLTEQNGGTKVEIEQNVTLSGPLAQFGRTGIIEDINAQMTRQFAACLQSKLSASGTEVSPDSAPAPTAAGEVRVARLLLGALGRRLAGLFRSRRK